MDIEIVEVQIPKAITAVDFIQGLKGDRGISITDFTLDDDGNAVTTFENGETKKSKLTSIASVSESAKKAAISEANAKDSADNALTSETNAKTSEANAATSAENAKASEVAAKLSETNAKDSETVAKSSEEVSSTKAGEASASATSASDSAVRALASEAKSAKSAESAEDSYNKTVSIQRDFQTTLDTAKASETAAKASEVNAKASETASADSASKAHTSELNAKASETSAATSASTATTQASNASKSATAAKTSETNAKDSETQAGTYAGNSKASADAAKLSETNAASSASSASDSKAGAATQASNATKSATAASSSASAAKTSETNSASSASSASTSASNAKASETNAKVSETNANSSATTAKNWAVATTSPDGAIDTDSDTGKTQSSRSWALASKGSAESASSSASTATSQASSATASAKSASESATSASGSATSASSSATAASNSASAAATSATNASNSETQASGYKTAASNSATAAASSATSASTSATNAKAAMNTANTAASSASTSATSASTSASNAAKSEVAAKTAQAAAEKARDDANSAVSKLTGVMKYAGQVDNYSDLADVTKNKGDVWNIVNADSAHGIKAGDNVAWNGTDWDNLSGTVDLSIYAEKADYQKAITSATANGATITFNHKDGTTSTTTVNNVASATAATNDAKGQKIDTTYEKVADASNVHTSLQNSINSLSSSKQDKLTFDSTPTADSTNPVTSGGVKTYVDNINSTLNTAISKKADSTDIVQADWNVTDITLQSYIKNKPSTWLTTNLSRPTATNGVPDYTMRSMIDSTRANRLAFLPPDQIIIEQTVDGGVTWTDAGFDDVHKAGLFDGNKNFALGIPKIDGKENTLCGLRVTITAMKYNVPDGTAETDKYNYWNKTYVKSAERYCSLDSFYIWCSTAGNRIKIKIEMATGNNASNWRTFFSDDTFGMIGGAGGNCIGLTTNYDWYTFGGDTTQYNNNWNCRLTFMTTSDRLDDNITINQEVTQSIISICGYGENIWTNPNRLAYNDHLYAWDSSQNATFPANVTANTFKGDLDGNANTATKLATARTISLTGNASGSATFDGSGNVSIDTTVAQATKATQAGDGNVIASTYATKDYVQQLMNTLSTVSVTQDSLTKALSIK